MRWTRGSRNRPRRAGPARVRVEIGALRPEHAADAVRLHIAGQPDTFLTSLGVDVLTVVYGSLPTLPSGFGYVASDEHGRVLGFVSATTSVGRLFLEIGTRRLGQLLPPLLAQCARHPRLIAASVQTALYPLLVYNKNAQESGFWAQKPDAASQEAEQSAELLSIMVEPEARGQGIGTRLLETLMAECEVRRVDVLDVTVDANNEGAQRFYERHGFVAARSLMLHGRAMWLYRREV